MSEYTKTKIYLRWRWKKWKNGERGQIMPEYTKTIKLKYKSKKNMNKVKKEREGSNYVGIYWNYRVSLKKRSFVTWTPLETPAGRLNFSK